jgi:hypothetical protein
MLGHLVFEALIEVWKAWQVRRYIKRWIAARNIGERERNPAAFEGYPTRVLVGQHLSHNYSFIVTMTHNAPWSGVRLATPDASWKPTPGLEPAPTGDIDFDSAVQIWLEHRIMRPAWLTDPDAQHALGTLSNNCAFMVDANFAVVWMNWNIGHIDWVEDAMKSVLNTAVRLCNTVNAAVKGEPIPSFLEHKKPQPKQIKLPAKRKAPRS